MTMETVDIVIAGLGVAAIAATVLGLVFYDEIAGETELTFQETGIPMESLSGSVSTTPTEFSFVVPRNATGAELLLELARSSTATIQGGSATVEVEVFAPDNTSVAQETFTHTIPAGSQTGQEEYTLDVSWAERPEDTQGDPATYDGGFDWEGPMVVVVTVTPPGGPLAGQNFQFSMSVGGDFVTFQHAERLPEATNA